ncbi:FAR1-related sequence 5-like protein [Tanacetum coccineum]
MTTSSTSSLLSANSPTTNLPPATSTTTNLPPTTSTTSHLLLSDPTTTITSSDLFVVPVVGEENLLIEAEIEELDDVTMNEDVESQITSESTGIIYDSTSLVSETKRYDMVFVPFTGIDNHLKCVNFGSGMLLREDTEAYTWLLTSFMTAHEKQPTMVVTDQDGAMKRAIEAVLTESTLLYIEICYF